MAAGLTFDDLVVAFIGIVSRYRHSYPLLEWLIEYMTCYHVIDSLHVFLTESERPQLIVLRIIDLDEEGSRLYLLEL